LLPASTTQYPGGVNFPIPLSAGAIPHRWQPFSTIVHNQVSSRLALMGVGLRAGPTSTIIGPSSVRSAATCMWTANPSGGAPPYTYAWFVNSVPQTESGSSLTYSNSGSAFRVDVTVTDSHGLPVQVGKNVAITGTAPFCTF